VVLSITPLSHDWRTGWPGNSDWVVSDWTALVALGSCNDNAEVYVEYMIFYVDKHTRTNYTGHSLSIGETGNVVMELVRGKY